MSLSSLILILLCPLAALGMGNEDGGHPFAPPSSWQPPPASTVLQYRVMKIIENEQRRHKASPGDPVIAPTCIHAPTVSDFFDLSDIKKEVRDVAEAGPVPDLDKPAAKITDVFNLLRATRWGNAVMKKFYPRFGFDIRIDQFTEEMKDSEAERGRKVAAVYDIDKKTIYVNKSEKIGTVAPILLHEIMHSLDNDFSRSVERERRLWGEFDKEVNAVLRDASARTEKSPDDLQSADFLPEELARMRDMKNLVEQFRDIRIYRAERVAYDMYFNVLVELSEKYPKFYRLGTGKKRTLRPFDDGELIKTEGLNREWVEKYKRNNCKIAVDKPI